MMCAWITLALSPKREAAGQHGQRRRRHGERHDRVAEHRGGQRHAIGRLARDLGHRPAAGGALGRAQARDTEELHEDASTAMEKTAISQVDAGKRHGRQPVDRPLGRLRAEEAGKRRRPP